MSPAAPRRSMFAAFGVRNYARYAVGQFVSSTGNWMANTAQIWLVLVTLGGGHAVYIGWLSACAFGPTILLFPFVGGTADRFSKRNILIVTQTVRTASMLVLGLLTLTGHITLPLVFVLATVDGIASAFDSPARQAFVNEMVPGELVPNAVSLNSMAFNGARLIGPAIAGVMIARWDTGPVFLVGGVAYVGFIVGLLTLDMSAVTVTKVRKGSKDASLLGGLSYTRHRPDLILIMATAFVVGTFMFNFAMTNPLMSKMVFHKDAREYGFLSSVLAVGALVAAVISARRPYPRLRHIIASLGLYVVASTLMATAPTFVMFAVWLVPTGLCVLLATITCNQLMQVRTDDIVRGRVMALYMAIFLGGSPVFSPVLGWFGDVAGARWTIGVGTAAAAICLVIFVGYTMRADDLHIRYDADARRRFRLYRGAVTQGVPEEGRR